ncbi:putative phage protein GP19 [Magnetococcus marinus MC-1]|uniref:Putative phage protein GP19 n=1 Tax=Magnetococcus marinus (strain ATCC BAA-1437 / JCM 17883 / MC-1) TaxID=156889 RepID=A0L9A3_MAGMM|nr:head decoration protein [Magnetococcus marinus]ABK44546.1 putative phage protein GP19 [Magnetococcus marinus MC-1]
MPAIQQANNLGDVLKFEAPNLYSRETVTVLGGVGTERVLPVGTLIGRRTKSEVAAAADASNSGDGTIGTVTLGSRAVPGVYSLTCIIASADSGTFQVVDPNGHRLPDVTVGVAYDTYHLKFTIDDGATDFVLGDHFTVLTTGDGNVVAMDPTAVDGSADPIGIIAQRVVAPVGQDTPEVAILRHAILADHAVVWPESINETQKLEATAALEARGILIRQGV